jgi:DNA repair protein RadC
MANKGLGDASGQELFADLKPGLSSTEPDYAGHRQRLRERFLNGGADSLPDYELLELMLFMAQPRVDTKPVAKELLRRFGSFAEVIAADPEALRAVKGIGDAGVVALKAAQAAAQRLLQAKVKNQTVIGNFTALIDYCTAQMAFNAVEQFRVIYLDKKNKVIADEEQQKGTVDHTPVYPREVVKRALELNASALIMVHNHPSGDPKPSQTDIDMTRKVKDAAAAVGLTLHDHVIVSRGGHASFKSMGLI